MEKMYMYSRKVPYVPIQEFEIKNKLYITGLDGDKFYGIATQFQIDYWYYGDFTMTYELYEDYMHGEGVYLYCNSNDNPKVLSFDKKLLEECHLKELRSERRKLKDKLKKIEEAIENQS